MNQGTFADLSVPESTTLREAARIWMERHPRAMDHFRRFARQMLASGRRGGFKAIAERVRWECSIEDREDFKLNNNWTAYVARQLVVEMPDLADLIECRRTKAADLPVRDSVPAERVDPRGGS